MIEKSLYFYVSKCRWLLIKIECKSCTWHVPGKNALNWWQNSYAASLIQGANYNCTQQTGPSTTCWSNIFDQLKCHGQVGGIYKRFIKTIGTKKVFLQNCSQWVINHWKLSPVKMNWIWWCYLSLASDLCRKYLWLKQNIKLKLFTVNRDIIWKRPPSANHWFRNNHQLILIEM